MIQITFGKYTCEAKDLKEAIFLIEKEKINMQEAMVKFRVKVPGVAFEELVKEIESIGGAVV